MKPLETDIERIISEVEDMHPYKESGNRESFSQYNEGWADACDILGNRILEALGIEKKPIDENYLNELIEKATPTWKDVDPDKYINEVRGG